MIGDPKTTAGVVAPPPLLFAGGLALGWGLDRLLALPPLPLGGPARLVGGGLLLAAGVALILAALLRMRRARTAAEPWKPTTAIVSDGVFALSRNPIYLGMAALHLGLALAAASLGMALFLLPVLALVHVGVIRREERYLEARFGAPYRDYRTRVRRWL